MKTLKLLQTGIWTLFAGVLLNSCGTVSPDPIRDDFAAYDSSTPSQYDPLSSGILFYTRDADRVDGAVVTPDFVSRYNVLIGKYSLRMKDSEAAIIKPGDGLTNYLDQFGNHLSKIDAQHLRYFLKMNRWMKERVPADSILDKAANAIAP